MATDGSGRSPGPVACRDTVGTWRNGRTGRGRRDAAVADGGESGADDLDLATRSSCRTAVRAAHPAEHFEPSCPPNVFIDELMARAREVDAECRAIYGRVASIRALPVALAH